MACLFVWRCPRCGASHRDFSGVSFERLVCGGCASSFDERDVQGHIERERDISGQRSLEGVWGE